MLILVSQIRQVIQAQGIRIYQPPIDADDEVSAEHARVLSEAMPFSIIGSTEDVTTPDGRVVKGREYLWGVAEVENENHCDFRKLRSLLIRTYMLDLISTTEELHYENYRQAQMETRKFGEQKPRKFENPKFKEEEEALRKRFTEQVKAEEARFRQWEQHVRCSFRGRGCSEVVEADDVLVWDDDSLLRSATVSTRIWRWRTARSRRSRPSWTTCRSATAAVPAGGEESSCIRMGHHSLPLFTILFVSTIPLELTSTDLDRSLYTVSLSAACCVLLRLQISGRPYISRQYLAPRLCVAPNGCHVTRFGCSLFLCFDDCLDTLCYISRRSLCPQSVSNFQRMMCFPC